MIPVETAKTASDLANKYLRRRQAGILGEQRFARVMTIALWIWTVIVSALLAWAAMFGGTRVLRDAPVMLEALFVALAVWIMTTPLLFWRYRVHVRRQRQGDATIEWLSQQLSAVVSFDDVTESVKMVRVNTVYAEDRLRTLAELHVSAQNRILTAALFTAPFVALVIAGMRQRLSNVSPTSAGSTSEANALIVAGLAYSVIGGIWVLMRLSRRRAISQQMRREEADLRNWISRLSPAEGAKEGDIFHQRQMEAMEKVLVRDYGWRAPLAIACMLMGIATFASVLWWIAASPNSGENVVTAIVGLAGSILQGFIGAILLRLHETTSAEAREARAAAAKTA